jgi:hypothetical protein
MRKLLEKLLRRLPLQFRVLYRQFLLRVVDLEALSIQADIVGFLGQFAGVLIMASVIYAFRAFIYVWDPTAPPAVLLSSAWSAEQSLISTMMLVIGLFAVVTWDATFPDRRDVMVLSPLPVAPRTILFAKVAASGAILGLAVLAFNVASGIAWPLVLGIPQGGLPGALQSFAAYWCAMIAASLFLYCSVLTVQGFTALLLPRRLFLRLSAILQLVAFGLFLGVYFMQPSLITPAALAAPENQTLLAWSPSFWFFALFNQMNGTLPAAFSWLALRAWVSLGAVAAGAVASLLLCYLRTMKRTVEEPDLTPAARGSHWAPRFGSSLQTAIMLFSVRSLARSRQHRVAFAFFLALVFAMALSWLRSDLAAAAPGPLPGEFLISTFVMMSFAVFALRSVFSLPISLTANWVLRITQICPTEKYIAATRRLVLCFAVVPVWLISASLSLAFRPFAQVAAHLVALGLLGCVLAELSLIGFYKVPFTCSYLPGKSNVQLLFWGFVIVLIGVVIPAVEFEQRALTDPFRYICMLIFLSAAAYGLWAFNRKRAQSAVLYFEELPDEVITTLGLISNYSSDPGN